MLFEILDVLSHLSERHFLIFLLSWFIFLILGRALIRARQGRVGRGKHAVGVNIFLVTFVAACSLIQLVVLELSGSEPVDADIVHSLGLLGNIKYLMSFLYLHPNLRQIAWNVTLYFLCFLMNVIIPIVGTIILFRGQFKRSPSKMMASSVLTFVLYQFLLWSIGQILPVNNTKVGFYDLDRNKSFFYFLFYRSLQQSVAHLAVVGTAFSALINGFASVNFPLEQIMTMKDVDKSVVRERDIQLKHILRGIINRKKKIALEAFSISQHRNIQASTTSTAVFTRGDNLNIDTTDYENSCSIRGNVFDDHTKSDNCSHGHPATHVTASISVTSQRPTERLRRNSMDSDEKTSILESVSKARDVEESPKVMRKFLCLRNIIVSSLRNLWIVLGFDDIHQCKKKDIKNFSRNKDPSAVRLSRLSTSSRALHKEIVFMEKMSQACFLENAYFRELYEQSEYRKTTMGRFLYSLGHILSLFALLRFIGGLKTVAVCIWRSMLSHSGSLVDESTHDEIVSTVLSYLQEHLSLQVDVSFWSPLLSFLLITSLGLMQIRGFLDTTKHISMSHMDQKGFSLFKGEIYALLLAYASGCYFLACVVLLRVHLPRKFRMGVTVVLGEERDFGFYTWWYEIVFVVGTIVAAAYLWSKKKKRRNELEPMLTKAKYEQERRITMMDLCMDDANCLSNGSKMIVNRSPTEVSNSVTLDIKADKVTGYIGFEDSISDLSGWVLSMGRYFLRTKTNIS